MEEEEDFNEKYSSNEKDSKTLQYSIDDLIVQLYYSLSENCLTNVLDSLNLLVIYAKKLPIPLSATVLSYNFIPTLINLYFSPNVDIAILAAKLILYISYHPNSEFIEWLINNHFFDQILSYIISIPIQNQIFFQLSLKCVINIIIDFSKSEVIQTIYSNPKYINFFIQMLLDLSNKNIIKKIIVILSYISSSNYSGIEQKHDILTLVIKLLDDKLYEQFWHSLLRIPAFMIIDHGSARYIFERTKVLQICQEFIRSDNELLIISAIYCIGKYFQHSNQEICIDYTKIMKCAQSTNDELSYLSLNLLSNALSINSKMICTIEMTGNIYQLLYSFFDNNKILKCQIEAVLGMISILSQGTKKQTKKGIENDFLNALIQSLDIEYSTVNNLSVKILETLDSLLNYKIKEYKDSEFSSLCWRKFNEACGLDAVEELIMSDIREVSQMAQKFIKKMKINNECNHSQWGIFH